MQSEELIAKTFLGFEGVLANELKNIGAKNVKEGNRYVSFSGENEIIYKANFYLRTALSILKPISTFTAENEDDLYKMVQNVNWDTILSLKKTFAVEPTVHSSVFKHGQYAALKTKDAIVDQFRSKTQKRPYVDTENPDILINLHISEKVCTLSLNSSGEPLYKRGYRVSNHEAPLNEVLAAGLILLSGWNPNQDFIDPMCGSGTLAIEAALIANKIPPGIFRKKFAFENWPDFDEELFSKITNDDESEEISALGKIFSSDISPKAVSIARNNIKSASLHNKINLSNIDFFELKSESESGVIIINPPYGERLKTDDLNSFYENIGNTLKHKYAGFEVWILSSNYEAMKFIGLHPTKKIKVLNGSLECSFNKYQIYTGSKKMKFNNPEN